jgi:hypothetical protein
MLSFWISSFRCFNMIFSVTFPIVLRRLMGLYDVGLFVGFPFL